MAEKNIKISGIGDVTRADFVRAITDPDKFKEFADQQGWGNKRRQLAWNSLHNYAQGVQNGEINEINDMHQIVDDTGARTNKQEKYNWIGSKFDANGATAAFMNQIAKGMQTATKPTDKSLKSIPSVTSYLNQQWFGSNNPDWELFQKNDTLTNGVYDIANRSAKIKEGLTKYKNELTTNGAQYNWDGIDKDALYKNLDAAIASSNVATYAPLGITSDYINNALATRDLSTITTDTSTDSTQAQTTEDDPTRGFSEEELARYNTMTPEQQHQYLAQRNAAINLNNEKFLAQNQADIDKANKEKEDTAFKNWLVANGYYSPKAQASSYVPSRLAQSSMVDSKGKKIEGPAVKSGKEFDKATNINKFSDQEWDNFIHGDLTSDIHEAYSLKNADRHTTSGIVPIKSKLDWINYNYEWLLDTGKLNNIGDDVSSYVGASKGTVWRLKNSKRNSDGTYMYMRKRGNNLEFYRSKSWGDLRNNEYKKYISKHQWGGIFGNQAKLREQYSKDLKARQDAIKKQKIQSQPQQAPFGRSSVKSMGKNTNTLTTADKVAVIAAATDFLASFTANPIANGTGTILTTGADLASDISHGASFGQAAGNAAMNLGMGLIGFIPGLGTVTKAKKLKKILQVSSGAIQAYFIANNFKEGIKSLDKLRDGSATVQDYKNLIYGLQGAKGAVSSMANTIKRRGAAKAIKELPDKFNAGEARYTFKSNGKETQRLTQAQVKELQEKGSEEVSNEIKQLLNGIVVKPSKTIETKLGSITWTKKQKPIEYQYKPKEEIQKLLDDLQIQSQKSSMWNPGRQDYLSMTSEHNWSLPSISIGLGKNSVKEVIKRGKQLSKPNIVEGTPQASPVANSYSKPEITPTVVNPVAITRTPQYSYTPGNIQPSFTPYLSKGKTYLFEPSTKPQSTSVNNFNKPIQRNNKNNKKKSKKKRKHLDGGVLYDYEFLKSVHAFKQGGIIKAQSGIKTGVKVNPKTTWFDAVWSQNVNHILRGLSDNNYYTWLNSMQDKHGDLHKNAGTNFQTTPYNDKSVGDYQNLYKTGYNGEWKDNNVGYNSLGIMHAQNLGRYDLYGNTKRTSGDWNIDANHRYKTDSSYSQITDDRRLLGRKGDFTDEQLASVTEAFKNKGYNFALGKNDYYYLSPIEKSEQNQNTPKKDGSVTNPDIGKKSIFDKGKEYLAKLTSNPGNLYNAVETGKYLLANKATNDIFKIKAPNYVISPKYTSYQVMDNLAQQNAYHNRAAETMNQTSRPLTSSGQLQTAAQQESMNNANKLYLQGNAERNTWLEGQKQQSYKAGLYNMESAVDTANANAQQAYKTRMLNEYQDPRDRARALATNRQNWINALEKFNVIDPYVERKNAQQQYGLAKAQWDYQNDAKVLLAQQKYQQLLRQHQNDLNFNAYDTDEYRNLINAQKEAGARYYNNMYQVYGISNPGFRYKKGGKFEDISKFNTKEFYNTIRHSINTATKQSGDLSKLINTLFKKSNKK